MLHLLLASETGFPFVYYRKCDSGLRQWLRRDHVAASLPSTDHHCHHYHCLPGQEQASRASRVWKRNPHSRPATLCKSSGKKWVWFSHWSCLPGEREVIAQKIHRACGNITQIWIIFLKKKKSSRVHMCSYVWRGSPCAWGSQEYVLHVSLWSRLDKRRSLGRCTTKDALRGRWL